MKAANIVNLSASHQCDENLRLFKGGHGTDWLELEYDINIDEEERRDIRFIWSG